MSESTSTPSIADIAVGLVTAAASSAAPVQKVETAIANGVSTFEQHNPELAPVIAGATATVGALAETHGLETVWAIIEGLFPWLAGTSHTTVNVSAGTQTAG